MPLPPLPTQGAEPATQKQPAAQPRQVVPPPPVPTIEQEANRLAEQRVAHLESDPNPPEPARDDRGRFTREPEQSGQTVSEQGEGDEDRQSLTSEKSDADASNEDTSVHLSELAKQMDMPIEAFLEQVRVPVKHNGQETEVTWHEMQQGYQLSTEARRQLTDADKQRRAIQEEHERRQAEFEEQAADLTKAAEVWENTIAQQSSLLDQFAKAGDTENFAATKASLDWLTARNEEAKEAVKEARKKARAERKALDDQTVRSTITAFCEANKMMPHEFNPWAQSAVQFLETAGSEPVPKNLQKLFLSHPTLLNVLQLAMKSGVPSQVAPKRKLREVFNIAPSSRAEGTRQSRELSRAEQEWQNIENPTQDDALKILLNRRGIAQ